MRNPRVELEKLRKWRVLPQKDLGIGTDIERLCAGVKAESDAAAEVGGVLASLLPEQLRAVVSVAQLQRGVLTLRASHAAHRYTLESWLRAGGLAALRGATRTTIKNVKCV